MLAVLACAGALAASHRGLTGSISHSFHTLTNTHAPVPPNTPGRLTAIGSVRARYWNEALKIFQAHPVLGAGARSYGTARLRYRTEDLEAKDAHGFVVQTLSDLGLVGLALALALLAAWIAAAGRPTHPFNRRWTSWRELKRTGWQGIGWRAIGDPPTATDGRSEIDRRSYSAERIGMLSMLCLVVVFGVHSTVDWTWFVPGDACVALLCAGWLAGRGPLEIGRERAPRRACERDHPYAYRRVRPRGGWGWAAEAEPALSGRAGPATHGYRRRRCRRCAARRLGAVAAATLRERLPGSACAERERPQRRALSRTGRRQL